MSDYPFPPGWEKATGIYDAALGPRDAAERLARAVEADATAARWQRYHDGMANDPARTFAEYAAADAVSIAEMHRRHAANPNERQADRTAMFAADQRSADVNELARLLDDRLTALESRLFWTNALAWAALFAAVVGWLLTSSAR